MTKKEARAKALELSVQSIALFEGAERTKFLSDAFKDVKTIDQVVITCSIAFEDYLNEIDGP
jgi:hypothetical protein